MENDLNILHVIAPGTIAGAEKSALASVEALRSAGYRVSFAVIKESRHPAFADDFVHLADRLGVESTVFTTRRRLDPRLARGLRKHIRAAGITVVHTHGYKPLFHLLTFRSEVPALITTYHGATSHSLAVCFYERLYQILYRSTDCVFAVSEGAKAAMESRGPLRCRVAIIPNLVSRPRVAKPLIDPAKKTSYSLLYLGRLSHEKGADVLMEAMSMLEAPHIRLHVVGDGPERTRLMGQAKSSGRDNVVFHGFQRSVDKFLLDADILVMPSRTEGLPMALIEATALGLPVIASAVGGIPEVVTHGENALLVSPNDPSALHRAILEMTGDYPRFYRGALENAEGVLDRYSTKRWVSAAVSEYRRAVDTSRSG